MLTTITKGVTDISLSTSDAVDASFVNGVPLYARIASFNLHGEAPSDVTLPFTPSTRPDVSGSVLATSDFLNKLVKKTYVADGSGIFLGFSGIDITDVSDVSAAIIDVSFNGGYPIDRIYFELVPAGNSGQILDSSGTVPLLEDPANPTLGYFFDRKFDSFSTNALDLATYGYAWVLRAYYLNSVYTDASGNPDAVTTVQFSTVVASVSNISITPGNNSCTVTFSKLENVAGGTTAITDYEVSLRAARPELKLSNGSEIKYSDYDYFASAQPIYNIDDIDIEVPFVGLINGFDYKAFIRTNSKEYNGTSATNTYQVALSSSPYDVVQSSTSSAMPFGPPSITTVDNPPGTVSGFTVQANGSSIQDAILITPDNTNNIEDITSEMIGSTQIDNSENGGIYYVDQSGGPPFSNYYVEANSFAETPYNYYATDVMPDGANGQYFFIVSGQVGHYSVATSTDGFSSLFPNNIN